MLVDAWDDEANTGPILNLTPAQPNPDFSYTNPEKMIENLVLREPEQPLFSLEPVDYHPKNLKRLVTSSNILVMGLTYRIARLNLNNPELVDELEISKKPDEEIHKLFLDPTGNHLIISLKNEENYYLHLNWKKPKIIPKLKGILVESVAWDKSNTDPLSTKEILVGSSKGKIFELVIEANEKAFMDRLGIGKDQTFKLIYSFEEMTPVTGLRFEVFIGHEPKKYFVMATTKTRIYQFIGGPTFEAIFAHLDNPPFNEVPGEIESSELQFFTQYSHTGLPKSFAWLTEPGVFHGNLVFGSQNSGESVMSECTLLRYPNIDSPDFFLPVSLLLTEFHFILLYPNKVQAISSITKEIVWEQSLPPNIGGIRGLAHDPVTRSLWLYSEQAIFEIAVFEEDRNVWEMFMNQGFFELALQYCKNAYQKDRVWTARADHFYNINNFRLAAMYYGRTQKSFEEITLKFIEKNEQEALQAYLMSRLKNMESTNSHDATQFTLICTWLTELFLDKLNQLQEANLKDKYQLMEEEFETFLKEYKDKLDKATTFNLLSSHGRMKELLSYAENIEDFEKVISHHIQNEDFHKALEILSRPNQKEEYFYKFSPILMAHIPQETVDTWIKHPELKPRNLIPSLLRYSSPHSDQHQNQLQLQHQLQPPLPQDQRQQQNQAIRYLQHCVKKLNNKDPAIHNLLLALYAQQTDERPLLQFLGSPEPHFDLKYALRLCTKENKITSCVYIYSAMGLFDEAVELALKVDIELAKLNAEKLETEDTALRKKLWLRIARHIVESENNIKKAMELLQQTEGLLKIEDILPFFKDFTKIDDFKQEICTSLEEYNKHIEELKNEMEEATQSADLIRKDIKELRNKYGFVSPQQVCEICHSPCLSKEFYLFHCSHVFHSDCLKEEMLLHLDEVKKRRLEEILQTLSQGSQATKSKKAPANIEDSSSLINRFEKLKEELDDLIAADCPLCGRIMVNSISTPFLENWELNVDQTWEI